MFTYDDFNLIANPSGQGYVQEDSEQFYRYPSGVSAFAVNQPISVLQNADGSFSNRIKGYDADGNHPVADYVGTIKRNFDITETTITWSQNYPIAQLADEADIFVDDNTLDRPTNNVVSIDNLSNVTNNQLYVVKNDDGDITQIVFYDDEKTGTDQFKILKSLKLVEQGTWTDGVGLYTDGGGYYYISGLVIDGVEYP